MSSLKELCDLLDGMNARVTFDRRRDVTRPCWLCDTEDEPRRLIRIGTYDRPMGGNKRPGDPIMRPLCDGCIVATEPLVTTG